MKYEIDFSIFASPTNAYGNVTGEIDMPVPPVIGQEVVLDQRKYKIISLSTGLADGANDAVGLEPVVLSSKIEAKVLAERLESALGLFCVVYDDI